MLLTRSSDDFTYPASDDDDRIWFAFALNTKEDGSRIFNNRLDVNGKVWLKAYLKTWGTDGYISLQELEVDECTKEELGLNENGLYDDLMKDDFEDIHLRPLLVGQKMFYPNED